MIFPSDFVALLSERVHWLVGGDEDSAVCAYGPVGVKGYRVTGLQRVTGVAVEHVPPPV